MTFRDNLITSGTRRYQRATGAILRDDLVTPGARWHHRATRAPSRDDLVARRNHGSSTMAFRDNLITPGTRCHHRTTWIDDSRCWNVNDARACRTETALRPAGGR